MHCGPCIEYYTTGLFYLDRYITCVYYDSDEFDKIEQ